MIITREWEGLEAIQWENEVLKLIILPDLGSKIASIYDKRTGREWMDQPPARIFQLPVPGSEWGAWDRCGWDELFPSIDECFYPAQPWSGKKVTDHGELWSKSWDYSIVDEMTVEWETKGETLPYLLNKKMQLIGSRIVFEYRLANLGEHPLPYIWAPHPIVAAGPLMRIELPESVERVVVAFSAEERLGARGTEHCWPATIDSNGSPRRLNQIPERNSGIAEKLYAAAPLDEGFCRIIDETSGDSFKLIFDPAQLPYLGIWINGGGWGNEYHVALEPAAGYLDNLNEAYRAEQCTIVPEYGTNSWTLTLEVGAGGSK
ncbi:DUF5107 domain-containing protein [Paenibacillus eucommiae]|uniref:Galactose mutarotase n=1 Tax=Paenibacillus eucommiae TaxID=1355755 RepID=A0ABS4J7A0_9BACL|nr:DUF5107 domain-containing protein [Paenibacillus eucommiae]MBP1995719.1 hypothetical protein [Paenibacillus eucommiae]